MRAGAPWVPVSRIRGDEPVPGAHGVLNEAGINAGELAAADQPQRAVTGNVAQVSHRHRAEPGLRRQHRVEHEPKLRSVGVLADDQLLRLGQGASVTAEPSAEQVAGPAAKLIQIGRPATSDMPHLLTILSPAVGQADE